MNDFYYTIDGRMLLYRLKKEKNQNFLILVNNTRDICLITIASILNLYWMGILMTELKLLREIVDTKVILKFIGLSDQQ